MVFDTAGEISLMNSTFQGRSFLSQTPGSMESVGTPAGPASGVAWGPEKRGVISDAFPRYEHFHAKSRVSSDA